MNVNVDNQLMQVTADEQFLKNYQAVYYAMNAKPDCKSKVFGRRVIVEMEDIKNLNRKIVDKFKAHYEEAGFIINVTVSFTDHSSIEFNSWTTFEKYDWVDKRIISNITIKWEYNARLPQYPLPQKHTLVVRIADEISPEEMLNLVVTGKLEEMNQIEQEACPVVARVDFINSMLAEELLNIVSEWQEGLKSRGDENSKFFKNIRKYRRSIAYLINYVSLFIAILFSLNIISKKMQGLNVKTIGELTIDSFEYMIVSFVIVIIFCWIVDKSFGLVANTVFITLGDRKDHHSFLITKGDENVNHTIESKSKKNKIKIVTNVLFTLIFNVICGIIANNIPIFK